MQCMVERLMSCELFMGSSDFLLCTSHLLVTTFDVSLVSVSVGTAIV